MRLKIILLMSPFLCFLLQIQKGKCFVFCVYCNMHATKSYFCVFFPMQRLMTNVTGFYWTVCIYFSDIQIKGVSLQQNKV